MPRDYAQPPKRPPPRGGAARRNPPAARGKRSSGGNPGWIGGIVTGVVITLALGGLVGGIYFSKRGKAPAAPAASAQPKDAAPAVVIPPKQPSRFSFYELLPSYEVVIPTADAKAAVKAGKATTPDIAAPGQYLIQVGAYKTSAEADRDKARLALLGVESRIEQVTIDQTQNWYRVRIGPESSLAQAQEIVDRLDGDGIKGVLVKVKADAKP